jgi:hypothetical protein
VPERTLAASYCGREFSIPGEPRGHSTKRWTSTYVLDEEFNMSSPPKRDGRIVREAWLRSAVELIKAKLCNPNGVKLPEKLQVSVGIPHGRQGKKGSTHAIGQCWPSGCSAGGHVEIFIHPEISDPARVLDILVHEAIHAAGVHGHGKDFKAVAVKFGLEGKMTATVAGDGLKQHIAVWLKHLPPYPHDALDIHKGGGDGPKKQGTRMIKCECATCGYSVRTSQKWIDVGNPVCPCGDDLVPEGQEADED